MKNRVHEPSPSPSDTSSKAAGVVWVVQGLTGLCCDRKEWNVFAFTDEQSAKDYADFLAAKWRELEPDECSPWTEVQAAEDAMQAFDPRFLWAYPGTHWGVTEVPFAPLSAGQPADESGTGRRVNKEQTPPPKGKIQ